ncbi:MULTISPECIES: TonB-dependent hemoglobin/transferrin/lactoferrin family receptor [Halomonadaceae]|uniref:TonB-dependent hemoglobin/transferrin/lactoferrin family receptor n=1 Tax=Halomonadaceae TaxID=28256 RepID=UPI001598426B|nr:MULTISPECIES: TonB-dependent hemoglobin/transferrin/lactoferrin family receptor [Halomonas]QJQ95239.1 TonB-dependent hemoglobin/transferrin/lactoferrin family receptor [Halomonas sp. PA5]
MKRALSCTGALALSLLSGLTLGQEPLPNDDQQLAPLQITGTRAPTDPFRAPLIVDVIERDDATLTTASRVEDILADQPGLHVAGQGRRNGQTLSMRGFDRNGVLVRLDGVRQDIDTGHMGNFFLDPALLREVQIARGALSSLYGSNAMGGVVSFETVDAEDLLRPGETRGARLSLRGATASDELGGSLSLFGKRDTTRGRVDGLLSLGRSESGDIRRAGGQSAEEDATLDSLLAKGGWQLAPDHRLFTSWQHYREDATQPANPQQLDADSLRDRTTASDNLQLGHRWSPNIDTQLDSRITLNRQEIEESAAERTQQRLGVQSDGYHRLDHGWLGQTLAFGAEVNHATQRPGLDASGFPRADIDTAAIYLDDTLTAGRYLGQGGPGEFDLGLGARYDHYRAEDNEGRASDQGEFSPRLRLAWRPSEGLMLYSGYAEAFRAPTLSELYADERHFAGFCVSPFFCMPDNNWVPNPELNPETSKTWESGLALSIGDWQLRASYFDTRADDFIDTQVDIMAGTTQAVNVSRAQLWGYDARLGWSPAAVSGLDTFIGLSEVSGRDRDTGEALGSLTPLEALAGVDYRFAAPDLTLGWRGRFARAFDKQDDDERLSGYGLHDLQLAWRFTPDLTASFKLRNVADKVWYRPDGSLGDGRSLLASISMQW